MFNIRNMHIDGIWALNMIENKYINLINEALKKRNIFICSTYIHISIIQ